jgi:hypothetical protein
MQHRELASAISLWRDFMSEIKHNHYVMARVIRHIANRSLSAAFRTWRAQLEYNRLIRLKLLRSITRCVARPAGAASVAMLRKCRP